MQRTSQDSAPPKRTSGNRAGGGVGGLSWLGILRLGLVQTALGAIVVLTTSTLNRVMVVELALVAMLPGALVTLHHVMQLLRPRMGYGSDLGQRRTPWIVGGMAALAVGGFGAAVATALMSGQLVLGLVLAVASYLLIGGGVSAAGTSLLVLMAKRVAPSRRAAATTVVWMMMIAGFAVTATVTGKLLDPFSATRLVAVAGCVSLGAWLLTCVAMWRVEPSSKTPAVEPTTLAEPAGLPAEGDRGAFWRALREVWSDPNARRFTVFVLVSMLSYSAQDLILEPFAGAIFGWTPGESTSLSGSQHGGVFLGMLLVAVVTSVGRGTALASLKGWVVGGCLASAVAMVGLVVAAVGGGPWPLEANVFLLGLANGAFSIAAIASMMALAGAGGGGREGTRMGLWGAAQAIAFATGGLLGTVLVDVTHYLLGASSGLAYALVFALEATGFFAAHWLAARTAFPSDSPARGVLPPIASPGSPAEPVAAE